MKTHTPITLLLVIVIAVLGVILVRRNQVSDMHIVSEIMHKAAISNSLSDQDTTQLCHILQDGSPMAKRYALGAAMDLTRATPWAKLTVAGTIQQMVIPANDTHDLAYARTRALVRLSK